MSRSSIPPFPPGLIARQAQTLTDNGPPIPETRGVTARFSSDAARLAYVPVLVGQLGVQLDTGQLYRATAIAAGAWTAVIPSAADLNLRIRYDDYLNNKNAWAKQFYETSLHDVLWQADKRFLVTQTGFTAFNPAALFNNTPEDFDQCILPAATAGVVTITFNGRVGYYVTFPLNTTMYMQFYPNGTTWDDPASVSVRVYCEASSSWYGPFVGVPTQATQGGPWVISIGPTSAYCSKAEVTITSKAGSECRFTNWEWHVARPDPTFMAGIDRHEATLDLYTKIYFWLTRDVPAKITLDNTTGEITAVKYYGDGSALTGITGGGSSGVVAKRVTANVTESTATNTDITGLNFAIGANETWSFEAYLMVSASSVGGSRYGATFPSGTYTLMMQGHNAGGSGSTETYAHTSGASGTMISGFISNPIDGFVKMYGVVKNGATAGTVQLRFASTASGDTITIAADSYMVARKH